MCEPEPLNFQSTETIVGRNGLKGWNVTLQKIQIGSLSYYLFKSEKLFPKL